MREDCQRHVGGSLFDFTPSSAPFVEVSLLHSEVCTYLGFVNGPVHEKMVVKHLDDVQVGCLRAERWKIVQS